MCEWQGNNGILYVIEVPYIFFIPAYTTGTACHSVGSTRPWD